MDKINFARFVRINNKMGRYVQCDLGQCWRWVIKAFKQQRISCNWLCIIHANEMSLQSIFVQTNNGNSLTFLDNDHNICLWLTFNAFRRCDTFFLREKARNVGIHSCTKWFFNCWHFGLDYFVPKPLDDIKLIIV